jgi:hypothetical protein
MSSLRILVENSFFIVSPLVTAQEFISLCASRGLKSDAAQLRRFQLGGFFAPMAGFRRPKYKIKLERTPEGVREAGVLKEGENWTGEIIERSRFFTFRGLKGAFDEGSFFDPADVSMPREGVTTSETVDYYYSIFHCYSLWICLERMAIKGPTPDELSEMDGEAIASNALSLRDAIRETIPVLKKELQLANKAVFVCQAISNRYYPETQTDRRTILINSVVMNWDWHDNRFRWDAARVADEISASPGEVAQMASRLDRHAHRIDPLNDWYDLLQFVSVRERERLKGPALLACTFRAMALMLASFYQDLTGKPLPMDLFSLRSGAQKKNSLVDSLKQLEYVVNKYNLNPRPRLILVLEGPSEIDQVSRIVGARWGSSLATLGIELVDLKGVGNFTGRRSIDRFGALQRFIDAFHDRQTIVYVLVDNEGGAETIARKLASKPSAYFPGRTVTKKEYVHVWKHNYEFDNFTEIEIAKALSNVAGGMEFTAKDVESYRVQFCTKDALGKLFSFKAGRDLPKRDLGRELVTFITAEIEAGLESSHRPILDQLSKILELAAFNHQPMSPESWEENQKSGYFGDIIPGSGV